MKEIKHKDLIVGEVYYDTKGCLGERLKFMGRNKNTLFFKVMSKNSTYVPNKKGLIDFSKATGNFYQKTKNK